MNRNLILGGLLLLLVSCRQSTAVDLIVVGGNIQSMDSSFTPYQAMVINQGLIVEMSNDTAAMLHKYKGKQILRLPAGSFVYPGFIDPHAHFYGLAQTTLTADLRNCSSETDMINRVQQFYKNKKPVLIRGRGWDQNIWDNRQFPVNTRLNELYPDVPVILTRIDGHAALVNQKALDLAGITPTTAISGGELVLDNGKLTGLLIDNAVELVEPFLPRLPQADIEQGMLQAQKTCFGLGLTSVSDAGVDKETIDMYQTLHQQGDLKIRIYAMANPHGPVFAWLLQNGVLNTGKLHVQSVKYYMDGAMGSRGACLLQAYTDDPANKGFLLNPPDSLRALATTLKLKNLQLNVHCIGDSANRITLQIMAEILGSDTHQRWRIEHAQLVHPSDIHYFYQQGIIASMQPTHATSDAPWVGYRLGDRVSYAYPIRTMLDSGVVVALGTDFPVEEVNPFYTLYAAITRKHPVTKTEHPWKHNQRITREQALRGITTWAAYAQFEEKEKGSLEPGKMADFIVLQQDLFTVKAEEIPNMLPIFTYCAGEKVYEKN